VILPHGDAHVLSSDPAQQPARIDPAWVAATRERAETDPDRVSLAVRIHLGRARASPGDTELVCGFLSCDRHPFNPLLDALPRLLHLPAFQGSAAHSGTRRAGLRADRGQPGAAALLERASETMFIDALRRYLELLPAGSTGWLAGLRDPQIGRALA
jgi:hypothetical protein